MRLWLSKNSEVPIREQLITQITLGIVSNDLKPSERLPSTRDLARRYSIHANTVSAAYRELARRGWVEFRKGSGVYVRARNDEPLDHRLALDQLIGRFFRNLREDGHSLAEIQAGVQRSFHDRKHGRRAVVALPRRRGAVGRLARPGHAGRAAPGWWEFAVRRRRCSDA